MNGVVGGERAAGLASAGLAGLAGWSAGWLAGWRDGLAGWLAGSLARGILAGSGGGWQVGWLGGSVEGGARLAGWRRQGSSAAGKTGWSGCARVRPMSAG